MSQSPEYFAPSEAALSAAQLDVLVRQLPAIPTFPSVAARLLDLMSGAHGQNAAARASVMAEAIDLIECDPPTAARLLSMAAARGAGVCSVGGAAKAVGFEALRSAVLSITVFDDESPSPSGMDREGLWKHSLGVALAAEMLAHHTNGRVEPQEAYVCGLLHELGKMALDHCMPKSYRRAMDAARLQHADIGECERRIIGVEHSAIGRRLAEHWRLPRSVRETIWLARHPAGLVPKSVSAPDTIALVNLADTIAVELRLGSRENRHPPSTSDELAGEMGISPEVLGQVVSRVGRAVQERYNLLGLGQPTGHAACRIALAGANAELGRINAELLGRAESLAARAAAFTHFTDFAADITPESTVADVLERLTKVVAVTAGAAPTTAGAVVAYSMNAADDTIMVACRAGGAAVLWLAPEARPDRPVGAEPPADAGKVVDMIFADSAVLGRFVDRSLHVHQPLLCGGRWIGGVFYPRPPAAPAPGVENVTAVVAGAMGLTLATVQERSRQMLVSEQLAGASQALSATQEALAEAKALSAAGEMATGAAHELNTPLAIISGRAQLMSERADEPEQRKTWRLVADQAHRISDIISELMVFASPQRPSASDFDVGELLHDAANVFASSDHPQATPGTVDIEVVEGPLRARADRDQIHAAILELMVNAANAAGGDLRIRLAAEFDEINAMVLLTVRDAGSGMDERTAGRAFTPFFSVQKAGRRRGMGLPRVKRVVENNGGRIWIDSQVGVGTTVTVQLPMA